jgi:Concanavalin A-like lectin/glucanases superfamily
MWSCKGRLRPAAIIALGLLSLIACSCSNVFPEGPQLLEVRPAWKWRHETKSIQITGKRLYAWVQANFDDQDKAKTLLPTVKMGTRKLKVTRLSQELLDVVVPNDLPAGWFDLTVSTRGGRSTLVSAFEVCAVDRDGGPDASLDGGPDLPWSDLSPSDLPLPDVPPPPPICTSTDPTLEACFRFEGNLADESSNNLGATASNVSYTTGVAGKAVATSASSSISVKHNVALNLVQATLEVWVRPDVIPTTGRVAVFDKSTEYGVFIYAGGVASCRLGTSSSSINLTAANSVSKQTWTHLACTYDGVTGRLFVNGTLQATGSGGSLVHSSSQLRIGEDSPSGGDQLLGRIDNLRIWNKARSSQQICKAAGTC